MTAADFRRMVGYSGIEGINEILARRHNQQVLRPTRALHKQWLGHDLTLDFANAESSKDCRSYLR